MRCRNVKRSIGILIASMVLSGGGCATFRNVIDPANHKDDVLIASSASTYGTVYSYEHKIKADILLGRGDIDGAVKEYEQAVLGDSRDSGLRVQLAKTLLQQTDLTRAKYHIAKAILLHPGNGEAWAATAMLHEQGGNPKKAIDAAIHGYQVDRSDVSSVIWLAQHFRKSEKPSQKKRALHYYQLALVRCHTRADLYLAAGELSHELHYRRLATRYLEQYLSMFGENTAAILHVVNAYKKDGNIIPAVVLLQKMLSQRPQNDEIREELIRIYLDTNQNTKAVTQVLSLYQEPSTPALIVQRTDWLIAAAAPWEARSLVLEQFSASPTHPAVRLQLAKVEALLERKENAALLLQPVNAEWPPEYHAEVEQLRIKISTE